MGIPVQRTYLGTPAALNAPVFMVDQQTLQNNFLTLTPNVLQDVVNNPDPAAGLLYSFTLVKNGNATAVRAFSCRFSLFLDHFFSGFRSARLRFSFLPNTAAANSLYEQTFVLTAANGFALANS